jgi:hypothetical protein
MKKLFSAAALVAMAAVPMAANAVVYQFTANLSGSNEVPMRSTLASGVATLFYDTADNSYDFALSVFNLTTPATAYHIHGAATTAENGPVRVALDSAPFVGFSSGGTLLVGGSNVAAVAIPATAVSATNAGHSAMSFLELLQTGLAYVNVHTAATFPGGEVRGQLTQVAVVPEPGTYALLLGGLAAFGFLARRRHQA